MLPVFVGIAVEVSGSEVELGPVSMKPGEFGGGGGDEDVTVGNPWWWPSSPCVAAIGRTSVGEGRRGG